MSKIIHTDYLIKRGRVKLNGNHVSEPYHKRHCISRVHNLSIYLTVVI